jgi:hypothetical protein
VIIAGFARCDNNFEGNPAPGNKTPAAKEEFAAGNMDRICKRKPAGSENNRQGDGETRAGHFF